MKKIKTTLVITFIFILLPLLVYSQDDNKTQPNQVSSEQSQIETTQNEQQKDIEKKEDNAIQKLGTIVVTPTKTARSAQDTPASLSLVTKDDIKTKNAHFVDQSLKNLPGVMLDRSKFADTTSSINIRGFNGDSRNLVLLDGMPLNDAYSAGVNWSLLSNDNIEQIEVVKGAFSSLYGRNAMGGVVNIITRTPEKQDIMVKAGYGSYNTLTAHAHYGDKFLNKLGFFASFDYRMTDGHRSYPVRTSFSPGAGTIDVYDWERANDDTGSHYTSSGSPYYIIGDKGNNFWKQWITTGKIYYDIKDDSRVSFSFNIQQYQYGYRNAKSYLTDIDNNTINTGDVTITDNGVQYHKNISQYNFLSGDGENFSQTYSMDYTATFGIIDFSTKVGYNEISNWYTTPTSGSDFSGGSGEVNITDPKRTLYFDAQADINLDFGTSFMAKKHVLTVGVALRYDNARGEQWTVNDWKDEESKASGSDSKFSYMRGNQILTSLYTQLELGIIKKLLTLYAGARYDHWVNFDGYSRYEATVKEYDQTDDWQISPKVSLLIKPDLKVGDDAFIFETVRMSYGWAFTPPDIFKLYKYWEYYGKQYNPNPSLKPEKAQSWECGLDFSFAKKWVLLSGTYFGSIITDMFYNRQVDSSTKKYGNAGEGTIHGCEAELKLFIYEWFEIYGNITYMHTEITDNDEDPDSEGKQFQGVPELMYNTGLIGRYKYVEGSINWRFMDKVYGNSDNSDEARFTFGANDTVMLLDLKVSVMPVKHLKLSFGVDNLLDREYYQYYKCEGRTFFGSAEMTF